MTDQELTFDQLQTVVGGVIHPDLKPVARRVATKGFDIGPVAIRGEAVNGRPVTSLRSKTTEAK